MSSIWVWCLILLHGAIGVESGGLKKRLADDQHLDAPPAPTVPLNNIRSRLSSSTHCASASNPALAATSTRTNLRQRCAPASSPDDAGDEGVPRITRSLRRDWARGKLTSRQVQEYAEGAQQSGAIGLDKLARAGASGRHPANVQRALLTYFGRPKGAPKVEWVELPMKDGKRRAHLFLFPHSFLGCLF